MPRPCSVDLRERALLACDDVESCRAEVARRFRLGVSTLHLWRKQAHDEGRRAPLRMGRGPAPLGGRLDVLAQIATERTCALPGAEAVRLGAQAKTLRASEQDRADVAATRTAWQAEAASGLDPARLILIDESGFDTRLVRTHARAPRGQRAHGTAPGGHWHRLTLIGALGLDGLSAPP